MNIQQFIKLIRRLMSCSIEANYSNDVDMTPRMRYRGLSQTFDRIIAIAHENYQEQATAYYAERSKGDAGLERLQNRMKEEIERCIEDTDCRDMHRLSYRVVPASSFSARTHLTGESDIDFAVLIKRLDTNKVVCASNALGRCDFMYNDLRNKESPRHIHWVFQKFVDEVEIEAKVRDDAGFKELLKMHDYLDHRMPQDVRVLTTYVKHILKRHNHKAYDMFKMLYYCQAGYHGRTNELMYPLV